MMKNSIAFLSVLFAAANAQQNQLFNEIVPNIFAYVDAYTDAYSYGPKPVPSRGGYSGYKGGRYPPVAPVVVAQPFVQPVYAQP